MRARIDPKLGAALDGIAADRQRGAHALAVRTVRALERSERSWGRLPPGRFRATVRAVASRLSTVQPAMGPFRQWSREWRELARDPAPEKALRRVRSWLRTTRAALDAEPRRLALQVRRRLPPRARILMFSRSESVLRSLVALPRWQQPVSVLALVSDPGGEGRRAALELRREGIPARTVPDLAFQKAVREVDLVLVGADTVDARGTLVHKIGTRRLARAALAQGRPVVVVAGSSKWLDRTLPRGPLPPLFDRTPRALVSAYWTDRGAVAGGASRGPFLDHRVTSRHGTRRGSTHVRRRGRTGRSRGVRRGPASTPR